MLTSTITCFQTEHYDSSDTSSPIMYNLSVETSLTLDRNISDEDFDFLQSVEACLKNKQAKTD